MTSGTYGLKTSKNKCEGGTFNQRAEISSKKAISTSTKAIYNFQSLFKFHFISHASELKIVCDTYLQYFSIESLFYSFALMTKYFTYFFLAKTSFNLSFKWKPILSHRRIYFHLVSLALYVMMSHVLISFTGLVFTLNFCLAILLQ